MNRLSVLTSNSYKMKSWRKTSEEGKRDMVWNKTTEEGLTNSVLRWDLHEYERGEYMVRKNKVRILVLGLNGHGKTSLLSSFTTALKKKVVHTGLCGERDEGINNVVIKPAMKVSGEEVFFTFVDMPCLTEDAYLVAADKVNANEDGAVLTAQTLKAAMQGHIQDGVVIIKEKQTRKKGSANLNDAEHYTDKMCCVVVVIKSGEGLSDDIRRQLNMVFLAAADSKIQVHVVLTNIDMSHHALKKPSHLRNIFWSKKIENDVAEMSKQLWGIAENCIHPVLTYTSQTESNTEMNILLLYTLRNILNDATQHAETLVQESLIR